MFRYIHCNYFLNSINNKKFKLIKNKVFNLIMQSLKSINTEKLLFANNNTNCTFSISIYVKKYFDKVSIENVKFFRFLIIVTFL